MTQTELLQHIADAIQRDEPLHLDMRLDSIEEWDSLAIISLISLYDNLLHIQLTGGILKQCQSIADLINLAKDRLE